MKQGFLLRTFVASGTLIVPALCLFLAGCTRTVSDFTFRSGGMSVALHARTLLPKGNQGKLLQDQPQSGTTTRATSRYSLDAPQAVTSAAPDFYLHYRATGGPLMLHVYEHPANGNTNSETSVILPDTAALEPSAAAARETSANDSIRYLLPLPIGTKIVGFRVTTDSSKATVDIIGAGLTADFRGLRIGSDGVSLRNGMSLSYAGSTDKDAVTTVRFPSLVGKLDGAQAQIVLAYSYGSAGSGLIHMTAEDSTGRSARYIIEPRPGSHRLYLYTASLGFTPESIRISTDNAAFGLQSIEINRFETPLARDPAVPTTVPIPADFGTILAYQPDWWRHSDYELFSWSLVPSVIVVEFQTYAIQARFMKRLAYFVEKRGFAGGLWTNSQLAGRHGWNAHDYRPEDLARFYSAAAHQDFVLNPEEETLKTILLANGLISGSGASYEPGKGAILTFAHVGPRWLRWVLLTHEGYHGIFFTHPAYRKAVFAIWDRTPPEEQAVFRDIFLNYTGYDTGDPYLVKNEFQAYLMQQAVGAVAGYFHNELLRQMHIMGIPSSSAAARFVSTHIQAFTKSAEEVRVAVKNAAGVGAGNLVGLQPD